MRVDVQFESPGWSGNFKRDFEEFKARFFAEIALQITKAVRNRSKSFWPRRTGFSQDRFITEDTTLDSVETYNTATYAKYVEFKKGTRNYLAARRTVDRFSEDIVKAAVGHADGR